MDDQRPAKRRRIQKSAAASNPFLDLEAGVDDDDRFSEEEAEWDKEGLVSDAEEIEDDYPLSHRMLSREYERAGEIEWSSFLTRAQNRGAHNRGHDGRRLDTHPRLLASHDNLYEIGCKPGMEEVAVFKLEQRISLHPEANLAAITPAFFACKSLPGRIFTKVTSHAEAISLASQIPELSPYNARLVPHTSASDLLTFSGKPPREQTWVRMKSRRKNLKVYLGDTALLVKVESCQFELWLIPRAGAADGASRPVQRLLDHRKAGAAMGYSIVEGRPVVRVGRNMYSENGFLILFLPPNCVDYYAGEATPTLEEFTIFRGCEALNLPAIHRTEEIILRNNLCIGDRVKVALGSLQGLSGVIRQLLQNEAEVYITSLDVSQVILRSCVRKYFRVGDQVIITSGDHKDKTGWVVETLENKAMVFFLGECNTVDIPLLHLEFHEQCESVCLRDLARVSKTSSEEERLMKQNSNSKYIGKTVMVVGANRFKGYKGVIRDTTPSGEALLEMLTFNHPRRERFFLDQLRFLRKDELFFMDDTKAIENPAQFLLQETPPLRVSTPMPEEVNREDELSPAWDPCSRTPEPTVDPLGEPPRWLADSRLRGLRIQVTEYGGQRANILEVKSIDGETVTVRDRRFTRTLALSHVVVVNPTRKEDPVVSFADDSSFGRLYKIKNFGQEECKVRDFAARSGQGEALYTMATSYLAVIYPPFKN